VSYHCTRCDGTGFLNIDQVPNSIRKIFDASGEHFVVTAWMESRDDHDVSVCDCCGNGEAWYGEPGEHAASDHGKDGPYAYNGGLPECW